MMRPTALFFSLALGLTSAQRGWKLIAKDIGGGPLGVACFEDGQTCVSETSHILPFPGYDTIESLDGGATWAQVPDQDGILGVLALYNVAASGQYAVVSAEASIQWSSDRGHNFTAATGPAGGEIVRKLFAADGSVSGFAILGETTDGNTVGLVASNISADGGKSFAPINIGELDPGILSIDGSFSSTSWTVCGNEYVTAAVHTRARSRIQQRMLQRKHRRPAPAHAVASAAAAYHTQVVVSRDAGVTWNTVRAGWGGGGGGSAVGVHGRVHPSQGRAQTKQCVRDGLGEPFCLRGRAPPVVSRTPRPAGVPQQLGRRAGHRLH